MAFRSVSQHQFHGYGPYGASLPDSLTDENEWFADGDGDVIGVIAKAPKWSVTAFGRNADGRFLAFDATTDFADVDAARQALFAQMERVGVTPHPARAASHSIHIRQRFIADHLLAAGLRPIQITNHHEHEVSRVVFKRGTEFVTIIGVGDTVEDAATDIVNQARAQGVNTTPPAAAPLI
jgi:hypothetical protein